MPTILNSKSIYYDDVNLIAQPQIHIKSRSEIPKELNRIIVAPMQSVVGEKFALEALRLGLQVCLPRFIKFENQVKIWEKARFLKLNVNNLWFSIGLNAKEQDVVYDFVNSQNDSLQNVNILIDVANGYLKSLQMTACFLNHPYNSRVMVGNVHSANGLALYSSHINYKSFFVRVGIGQGGVCKTAEVTGYTRGQITEIIECFNSKWANQIIVADGGIRNSGCAVKAFGAGADFVMMGGYFARAKEAQNVIDGEYSYWGGASHKQQLKDKGKIYRHSEGREVEIKEENVKSLEELVNDLWGGISSGVSYSGYNSLSCFIGNGVFEIKAK